MNETLHIQSEAEMGALASRLAAKIQPGSLIFLKGQLGAGKTTFTRGFLRALGYDGIVKSPTYALVETYQFDDFVVHHFDFYRLQSEQELDDIGLPDYFTEDAICVVEWPEKAGNRLPTPLLCCTIDMLEQGNERRITLT